MNKVKTAISTQSIFDKAKEIINEHEGEYIYMKPDTEVKIINIINDNENQEDLEITIKTSREKLI